jgi:hypothetical protein
MNAATAWGLIGEAGERIIEAAEARLGTAHADAIARREMEGNPRPLADTTATDLRAIRGGLIELADEAKAIDGTEGRDQRQAVSLALTILDAEVDRREDGGAR